MEKDKERENDKDKGKDKSKDKPETLQLSRASRTSMGPPPLPKK